jgi:hypothetical protein
MSPGRIFLLDEDAVAGYLQDLTNETGGSFEYSETAGMKQVILKNRKIKNFDTWALHYFKRNYK